MYLSTLRLNVRIVRGFRSKRRTIEAILAKIHRHFNVSVAEISGSSHPSESVLAVASVAGNRKEVREILERVADAISGHPRVEVLEASMTEI